MTWPSWLAGGLAVLMFLVAAYCAARLAVGRLRRVRAESDADALHVLMGVAMAGMFEPRLGPVPDTVWLPVFAAGAAWFGWRAVRARNPGPARLPRCAHPVPHAVECAAMVYMLWPVGRAQAMAMPGMAGSAPPMVGNPALTLALALFMLGYTIWTADRLASLSRAGARNGAAPDNGPLDRGTRGELTLAPRLAACYKIAMSAAMGYMLVTML